MKKVLPTYSFMNEILKGTTTSCELMINLSGKICHLSQVKHWITFSNPRAAADLRYGLDVSTAGKYGPDSNTYISGHNILLAHAKAVKLYRNSYRDQQGRERLYQCFFLFWLYFQKASFSQSVELWIVW